MVTITDIPNAISLVMSIQTAKEHSLDNLTSVAKSAELVSLGQPNSRKNNRVNKRKNSKVDLFMILRKINNFFR